MRALVLVTSIGLVALTTGAAAAPSGNSRTSACPEAGTTSAVDDPGNHAPELSPAGTKVAFESNRTGRSQIYVLTLAGCRVRQVTRAASAANPTWSPDGRRIAFERFDPRSGSSRIWVVNADGTMLRRVTRAPAGEREPTSDSFPAWSPNGRTIAFDRDESSKVTGTQRRNIYVVNVDGTRLRRLTSGPFNVGASWSRSGAWIAWSRDSDIFRMRPDGSGKTRVTSSPQGWNGDTSPAWAPDGKQIVFERSSPTVGLVLYVATLGGVTRELTNGSQGNDSNPDWAPNGRSIVFERFTGSAGKDSTDLYVIRPDGTGLRRLTVTPAR